MKSLHHLGPSPEHAQSQALWPVYEKRAQIQVQDLVARELPAEGAAELVFRWRDGWNTQDLDLLRSCLSDDCGFIDSSTFQNKRASVEETMANCAACFEAFPDMAFYPQDDTIRSLPYLDYSENQWRIVIPWRGIARWTGPLRVPGITAAIPPSGQCMNFIGVDRYTISQESGEWKITHIDTDWDMLYGAVIQLSPIGIPAPSLRTIQVAARASRVLMPVLRRVGGAGRRGGHRRFDLPLNTVTSPEDWADINASSRQAIAEARAKTSA